MAPRSRKALASTKPATSETRTALVAAAVAALREDGFDGATAREIARRAGCNQSQVFYHYGSVADLLLAALDDVSARRMSEYRSMIDEASNLLDLLDSAESVLTGDLASGDLRVLVELLTHAHVVPGFGAEIDRRLQPWRELARQAVRTALGRVPLGALAPVDEIADTLVAALLGLELLESLAPDRGRAAAVFTRVRALALLLDGNHRTPADAAGPKRRTRRP